MTKQQMGITIPENIELVHEGMRVEVYRYEGNRGVLIGTADGFAEAAYIEGQPLKRRYTKSLAESVAYILREAR